MFKKSSVRRVSAIGRRRLLRPTREVIKQGLHGRDAGVRDRTAGNLCDRRIGDAGLSRDVSQVSPFAEQTPTDDFQPLLVLLWHVGLAR
jgi:hypothetical protein